MARVNLAFGCLLIALAGWYVWLTTRIPPRRLSHDPGLAFYPRLLAAALVLVSAVLVLQQVVRRLPRPDEAPPAALAPGDWARTAGLLLLTVLYVLLLPGLGFLVATPLFLAAAMLLAGAPRRPATALTVLGVTLAVYGAFAWVFRVALP